MRIITTSEAIADSIHAANIIDKIICNCPGTMYNFGISKEMLRNALLGIRAGTKALQEMDVDKEFYV